VKVKFKVKFIPESIFRRRYGVPPSTFFRKKKRLTVFSVKLKQRFVLVRETREGNIEPVHIDELKGYRLP